MNWMSLPLMHQLVNFVDSSKYVLFFLGTFFEGPVVMMGAGFLLRLGQISFWPVYLVVVIGDFASDIGWYVIGYHGARPFFNHYGHYLGITPAVIEKIQKRFHRHSVWILVVSKLTMGFGFALATLTVAGMLRVPFWRYLIINLVCGFIWTLFVFFIGYFFGNVYEFVPEYLRILFILCALTAVIFGVRALSHRLASTDW